MSLEGAPREQKMLKGYLPRVISPSALVDEKYLGRENTRCCEVVNQCGAGLTHTTSCSSRLAKVNSHTDLATYPLLLLT
jgi:hypothetical protein